MANRERDRVAVAARVVEGDGPLDLVLVSMSEWDSVKTFVRVGEGDAGYVVEGVAGKVWVWVIEILGDDVSASDFV